MLKKFNVNMYDFKNKAVEADDDDFVIIQVTPALWAGHRLQLCIYLNQWPHLIFFSDKNDFELK